MRNKETLLEGFEDLKILLQYLYMDDSHTIVFSNGLTDLSIKMTDDFHFQCDNLQFPDCPSISFDSQMTVGYMFGVIDTLKHTPAVQFPESFDNRFDEIKTMTMGNLALNKMNNGGKA